MKRILILTFVIIINLCNSQNRTNDKLPIIIKNNGILINSNGWLKNSSGQWINSRNKIPQDLGENQKSLGNYEKYSVGIDNFKSLESKDIKIGDSTFVILIKKYKDGFYTYSSIEKEWNNQNSCKYYVLSKSEFKKIKEIKKDTLNNIYLNILYHNDLKYINPKTFNDIAIAKDISKKMKEEIRIDEYGSNKLALNISYFKAKNIVQFYFYEVYIYNQDYIKMYGSPKPEDNDKYFETDILSFKQFINIE